MIERPTEKPVIDEALEASLNLINAMKRRVHSSGNIDVMRHTQKFREAAGEAASKVVEVAAQVRAELEQSRITNHGKGA